jgi:flagellar basal body P-ring formation protein FlgA
MLRVLLTLATLALIGAPARAAEEAAPPSLKADVTVTGRLVRIGDLVDHAGAAAEIAVFRSPDLGRTGAVSTQQVLDAIRPHGVVEVETRGLREVAVTRQAREIGLKEIEEQIAAAVAGSQGLGPASDLSVVFDRDAEPVLAEPFAGGLKVLRARYDRYSSRFDVTFSLPGDGDADRQRLRFTGRIIETIEVATLARPLSRGDVIRASDVAVERQPKASVRTGTLTSSEQIVGFAARRPLRPGQALQIADVMKPELVVKNEAVSIFYQMPGMMLSVRGKALESGADGDLVTVFNAQTKRTLQGVVAGPGRVNLVTTSTSLPASDVTGSIAAKPSSHRTE